MMARLSVVLFAVLLFWFVFRFVRETKTPLSASCLRGKRRGSLLVFCLLLGVGLAVFLAAGVLALCFGRVGGSLWDALRAIWSNLDSRHYLHIAEHWYASEGDLDNVVRIVFLPGYPVAIWLARLVFRDTFLAATIVSLFSFAGAGTFLFRLVRLDYGTSAARRAVCFFAAVPGAFFFSAPMSESLFLLCTLSSVYFMRTKKWLPAALCGAYAAFTRSVGGLLFGVFLIEAFFDAKDRYLQIERRVGRFFGSLAWKAAVSLLIPAGLGAYLLINYAVFGDPFQFLTFQAEHWHQHLGLFPHTVTYMIDYLERYLADGDTGAAIGMWGMGLFAIFTSLFVLAAGGKRLRTSYLAYAAVYFAVSIGATWLLSAPRYLAALFPLPVCLALLTRKKPLFLTLFPLTACLNAAYLTMFVLGWQVW